MNVSLIRADMSSMSGMLSRDAAGAAPGGAGSFADQLRAAGRGKLVDEARSAAEQVVSSAFIMPVLSELRGSNMSAGPFAPGDAERRFGPVLDQQIADRLTQGSNFPLVDRMAEDLLRPAVKQLQRGASDGTSFESH